MKLRPVLLMGAMALALGAGLGGCGKRGTLERPPPLWGKQKSSDADSGKDKADGAQVQRSGDQKPVTPETRNLPSQAEPVETGKSDPVGASSVVPH